MPFRMAHGVHGGITKHIQVVHIVKFIVIVLVKELGKSVSSKVNMPFRMAHGVHGGLFVKVFKVHSNPT